MNVTSLSKYDDVVWNFSKDYHAVRTQGRNTIRFVGVWERHPAMCETAKAFAWARKNGTATRRPCGWGSVRTMVMHLSVFAQILETMGHTTFAALTVDNFDEAVLLLPPSWYGAKTLGCVAMLYAMPNLPHIPPVDPFQGQKASQLIRNRTTENTKAIPDYLIQKMVHRCFEYERRLPDLLKLKRSRNWNGRFAKERGITGVLGLIREWQDTQMAACILILAATGMRCSELLSLERGCLECVQTNGIRWYLWGMVFKFHGIGREAKWSCSRLGRRGYHILDRLASQRGKPLVTNFKTGERISGATVNLLLKRWMARQEWRDDEEKPFAICSHQFRPTFAQQAMVHARLNEYALKDHFKHHNVNMTDGYVGKSRNLKLLLLANCPTASKVSFEEKMRKAAGI